MEENPVSHSCGSSPNQLELESAACVTVAVTVPSITLQEVGPPTKHWQARTGPLSMSLQTEVQLKHATFQVETGEEEREVGVGKDKRELFFISSLESRRASCAGDGRDQTHANR